MAVKGHLAKELDTLAGASAPTSPHPIEIGCIHSAPLSSLANAK